MARLVLPQLPAVSDPAVPFTDVLGPGAGPVLDAVASAAGAEVVRAEPCQATYHPGRALTVRWDTTLRWAGGGTTAESLVLTAGGRLPDGALVLDDGRHRVGAWRVPFDPHLPGLAAALDPAAARSVLAAVGVDVASAAPRLRSYRPGRRAVVEVTAPGARLYLKIVPPSLAEGLHRRHRALAGHVPVPPSLGWSPDHGVVALQAVAGHTLRAALGQGRGLPGAGAVVGLLDALPAPVGLPPAGGWRASSFAATVAAVCPHLAGAVTDLGAELDALEAAIGPSPEVPVHGDLHEAQLLVDGGRVVGLLDVDTFGPGRRLDDLATLVGHLSTLAVGSPRRAAVERYAARLLAAFDRQVDPAELRAAVAAVVLGLATGPFRVLEPGWPSRTAARVDLAGRWLASARRLSAA